MEIEGLVGAWEMLSLYGESRDGERVYPYGESPVATLMYGADGSMAIVMMRQGRPKFASGDMLAGTADELKAAFEGFDVYCGTFTLDAEAQTVTHHIMASRFPNWEDTDQVRYFELSDDMLRITSPALVASGKE